MIKENALQELSQERIWNEINRALATDFPELFFMTLLEIKATDFLFAHFTKEALDALVLAKTRTRNPIIRFGVLSYYAPYRKSSPREFSELAQLLQRFAPSFFTFGERDAPTQLALLRALDYLRRPHRFEDFLLGCSLLHPPFNRSLIEKSVDALRGLDRKALASGVDKALIPHLLWEKESALLKALSDR